MLYKNVSKTILKWTLLLALLSAGVWCVRKYAVASIHLSTRSMEGALQVGDFVLVNKIQWKNNLSRNDILLFSGPLQRDTLHEPLLISRCIALPGDTVLVGSNGYRINGKEYPRSPHALNRYHIQKAGKGALLSVLSKLEIPIREQEDQDEESLFTLSSFEAYQIEESLPEIFKPMFGICPTPDYQLIVPQKNRPYPLDSFSLIACQEAIRSEAGNRAKIIDGKFYLDGRPMTYFFFQEDYYWLLSDNVMEAVDSRHLGFISESHIIGKLFFCWYSSNSKRRFKRI